MTEDQTQTVEGGMVPDVLHAEYSRLCTIAGDAQYRVLCVQTELRNANAKLAEVQKLIMDRETRRQESGQGITGTNEGVTECAEATDGQV